MSVLVNKTAQEWLPWHHQNSLCIICLINTWPRFLTVISPVDRVDLILPVLLGPGDGGQGVVGDGGQGPLLPPSHQPLQHLNLQIFPIRRPSWKLPWGSLRWLPLVFKVFKLKSLFPSSQSSQRGKISFKTCRYMCFKTDNVRSIYTTCTLVDRRSPTAELEAPGAGVVVSPLLLRNLLPPRINYRLLEDTCAHRCRASWTILYSMYSI